ncbi:MRG-domain-containing protein [Cryomyces antarcticus]
MAPPSASGPAYAKDEKALCFHHELLYEAKVLDSKAVDPSDKKTSYQYKVHYKGWKNTWDDWVPEDRLRKLTEENKELANSLKRDMDHYRRNSTQHTAKPSHKKKPVGSDLTGSSARDSEDRSSVVPPPPRGTKRGRDHEGIEKEEAFIHRPAVRIIVPDNLKGLLVDDWEYVTKNHQLVHLPSKTPVNMILDDYSNLETPKRRIGSAEAEILEEVVSGVREYFNKSLGRILLYKHERSQYHDILEQLDSGVGDLAGRTLCDAYGAEHLCRLFVSMPELIAQTNMDSQSVNRLREELSKMTQWLSKNTPKYFNAQYENQSQNYTDSSKMNPA